MQMRNERVRSVPLYRMAGLQLRIEVTLSWLADVTMRV